MQAAEGSSGGRASRAAAALAAPIDPDIAKVPPSPGVPRGSATLDSKVAAILGGRTAGALQKAFGISTVADMLAHFPRRYARRGELTALDELPKGETVTIVAEVRSVSERSMKARRGSILEVSISDGHGILSLTFFNQSWRARELKPGVRGIFTGKVSDYRGALQLAHPDYELFDDLTLDAGSASAKKWAEMPIPIYPASGSMASWQVQKSVELVLDALGAVGDPVPVDVRSERGLVDFRTALELVHRPQKDADWKRARDALRYQEAFVLQMALLEQRQAAHALKAVPRVPKPGGYLERFDRALAFTLTGDQQLVGSEISADLARSEPMNRLVQGEVGSGKTLVALRAMLAVADSGGQAALLAPTEVLASQHLRSIVRTLGPDLAAELVPTLHTGQLPVAARRKALLRMVSGQAKIVIGTHALLSDNVQFYDLGLVVVDEQHRFGVEQRETLRAKGAQPPHVLVLTATPIPRTVAMTVFGDLDISTISELPAGRQGISSFVVPLAEKPGWVPRIWERTAEELALGRQAFVVCPAIDQAVVENADDLVGDDADGADGGGAEAKRPLAAVSAVLVDLRANPLLAKAHIEALHGRMTGEEKDRIMQSFAAGEIDVLVATTVIEVGVDVPNASTMVVLDAERFGVSQLHQLRGRVGRGGVPGLCLLVTNAPLETLGRERVDAVASTLDGFELAQIDLELRREGNVLGSNQSGGRSSLRLLRVVSDGDLIGEARQAAAEVLEADAGLAGHPELRAALARRLDENDRAFLAKS
ncbi:ATP-dependent DNA helicase RecG [Subtercola boreus]|uniref:Probable DNA 3'-5' helicase RecG n=1 Tax=Subtercola boreus TaxID=120213 RepID=A0A3E0VGI1_9MICO|nr:ATP-dependent DNA helicase RecG [Subtercola boreus]RFA08653.1 ATP-dependent DNA helicase RecG [Subtercola boreus]TQL54402.1 ATP-dependent DNA helicase RecG [Subtercola boreus]